MYYVHPDGTVYTESEYKDAFGERLQSFTFAEPVEFIKFRRPPVLKDVWLVPPFRLDDYDFGLQE